MSKHAVTTPITPAPASNPDAKTCACSRCCRGRFAAHAPDANAPTATATENGGGTMNAIPALVGLGIHRVHPHPRRAPSRPYRSTRRASTVAIAAKSIIRRAGYGSPTEDPPAPAPPPVPVRTSATARHATAAGAGNCSPPSGYASRKSAYAGTAPRIPTGTPMACARSCFRGDRRIIAPALKSCIKSPACPAPPHATAAAMRFVTASPGAMNANTNWMILPIGPIGLMSVSPVHRTAM